MKFLFLMNPLETVNVAKDTSFIFMVGAERAGHCCYYLPQGGTSLWPGQVRFRAMPVRTQPDRKPIPFDVQAAVDLTQDDIDAVFVRTEPPFDQRYLMDTWLLERLPPRVAVLNSPRGLRTVNEKIWATQFTDLVPPTVITCDRTQFEEFLTEHGNIVAKPPDGFGGAGVFFVRQGDSNAAVIFEMLSGHGRKEVILQPFVPQASEGDKRILVLGGEILGAVLRVHGEGDHRNNFFAGGKPVDTKITERDREIVHVLRPHLLDLGLHFVGIDVIGEYLIEVNVTSPTCVQEINRLQNVQLEDRVIQYVEQWVQSVRSKGVSEVSNA